jgi:hypothetical protein
MQSDPYSAHKKIETSRVAQRLSYLLTNLPMECPMCSSDLVYAWEDLHRVGNCSKCHSFVVRATLEPNHVTCLQYRLELPTLEAVLAAETFESKLKLCLQVLTELRHVVEMAKQGIFSTARVQECLQDAIDKCRAHWDIIIRAGLADHIERESQGLIS